MSRIPNTPRRKANINDVARVAGVSVGTVSNTINHPSRVLPETLDHVWAVIKQLGYVPSHTARLLSGSPSRTMALVVPDVQSPFFMALAHAVEKPARASGFSLLLCNSENEALREPEILNELASLQARGALVSPAGDSLTTETEPPLPVVYLDHLGPPGACAVLVDHHKGAEDATRHLLALGHRTIGFVYGHPELWQFEQRLSGIRSAMEEAGLNTRVLLKTAASNGIGVESGVESAHKLAGESLPTAIICGNDMLAFGVHKGLIQLGIQVPEEISLVGYDDIQFAADWICPLTTVAQPMEELGQRAGELLVEHALADESHEHRTVVLEPQLIVRDSTARSVGDKLGRT